MPSVGRRSRRCSFPSPLNCLNLSGMLSLLAACYYLDAAPFWWCPEVAPFCPPSMRVELNLGLILRVEERSSLLRVSGDELATERASLPLPPRSQPPPAAVELPPAVMSARESDER